jgi:hypothetical protein
MRHAATAVGDRVAVLKEAWHVNVVRDLSSTTSYGRIEQDDCAALELLRYSGPGLVVPARSR